MKISTEYYIQSIERLPRNSQCIIAHQNESSIVVYQAYKNNIADFAIQNQFFGGTDFSYTRMSWIKTSFLWMMYRCGWGEKEHQERVLAIWILKEDFIKILREAVFSSFNSKIYSNKKQWGNELQEKNVRLQWDPDHDPYGKNIERRVIQLGLKGDVLERFGKHQIQYIEDITDFISEQKIFLKNNQLEKLLVPIETIYKTEDTILNKKIGIE